MFGSAVAIPQGSILVGAFLDDQGANISGSAYVFEPPTGTSSFRNAGSNPVSYAVDPPIVGSSWSAMVDLTGTGHSHAQILGNTGPAATLLPGGQVLLITGAPVLKLPLQPGPTASWTVPIPSDCSLVGLTVSTQAVHILGVAPFALSNAQDLVLGF